MAHVEAAWAKYCEEQNLSSRNCATRGELTYEKLYWKYVKTNFAGKYVDWEHYECTKSLVHGLRSLGMFDGFKDSKIIVSKRINRCVIQGVSCGAYF